MLSYQSYTDNELVLLFKKDDHAAFTEIYIRYSSALYNSAYKILQDRDEVKDLVQEVFTTLWNRRSDFTLNTNLAGYLYVAVRNKALKTISHQQVKSKYSTLLQQNATTEAQIVTDYAIREKQLVEIIDSHINELPAKMRQILNMSRKSYLTHKEIANELDLSESTVKKQVNNALKILRLKLEAFLVLFTLLILMLL
ncbi:RNA polymerase sigma-70 factor [Pedobacter panaciterrae]|uniref:RNA polymerase sigma-70 factor n=1 Tax=Pedobacter panaciterrae TaxID=363849 RepID=UPI00155D8B10|nr:RNA polymerase sigma-70 factor [Pedobacter panaciterrae]NQX57207.1 RNA polymerase sigma-70 factor [Pedobacter panaciterrae]